MATPLQAAAATGGAGGLAAAGAYGITYAVNSGEEETTENTELTEEQKNILNEPKDVVTFGLTKTVTDLPSDYQTKVLDVTKKENWSLIVKGSVESNKDWWEWAFNHKYSRKNTNKLDPIFASVDKKFLTSEVGTTKTALNLACEEAYKKEKEEFNKTGSHLVENIGLFCTKGFNSVDISEPEATLVSSKEEATYNSKLGNAGQNKTKLVKVKAETSETRNYNKFWWDWAFKNRFPKVKDSLNSNFGQVTSGYSDSDSAADGSKVSLNNACEDAYKKDNSGLTGTNPDLLTDVRKFCVKEMNVELEMPGA